MWITLSLLTALLEAAKDVLSKRLLTDVDEYTAAWGIRFYALPILAAALFLSEPGPVAGEFWLILIAGGTLNTLATILFMKALKHGDLSLTLPLITFTPVFLLVTSPLMLGERPNIAGVAGVLLIVAGSHRLHRDPGRPGWKEPLRFILKNRGARNMMMVAIIWSLTSNLDKMGIAASSVTIWAFAVSAFSTVPLSLILLGRRNIRLSRKTPLALVGMVAAGRTLIQMAAVSTALVPYVISIKRLSVIFAMLTAALVFHERGIARRLLAAVIMIIGAGLITLA